MADLKHETLNGVRVALQTRANKGNGLCARALELLDQADLAQAHDLVARIADQAPRFRRLKSVQDFLAQIGKTPAQEPVVNVRALATQGLELLDNSPINRSWTENTVRLTLIGLRNGTKDPAAAVRSLALAAAQIEKGNPFRSVAYGVGKRLETQPTEKGCQDCGKQIQDRYEVCFNCLVTRRSAQRDQHRVQAHEALEALVASAALAKAQS